MSARGTAAILAVALAPGLGSCALIRGGTDDEPPPPQTVVVVDNGHWADVSVYMIQGNVRVRLGSVSSMSTAEFVVPPALVSSVVNVRLVADPVGAEPYVSELLLVGPGDTIEFRIANALRYSSVSVWQ
jgi:hypothetical protein